MEVQMDKRTIVGKFIHNAWLGLNMRCSNGKYFHLRTKLKCISYENILIEFSREEFKRYCLENKELIEQLARPSLDRIKNEEGYSLSNIQIIELADNISKNKIKAKDGKTTCYICKENKDVSLFSKDNRVRSGHSNLCKVCDNKRKGLYKTLRLEINE